MANFPGPHRTIGDARVTSADGAPDDRAQILLAEDNPIVGELIVMLGKRIGLPIAWVCDGLEAITMICAAKEAGRPYSLLLLDAMMPIIDGIEVVKRLRATGITETELPVVAVTAATAPHEVQPYLAAGMQAYLSKPVSIADLTDIVQAWAPQIIATQQTDSEGPSPALIARYQLRKTDLFERIEAICAGEIVTHETVSELRNMIHKLAGTAGSFGEEALSELALALEARLNTCKPTDLVHILCKFREALSR